MVKIESPRIPDGRGAVVTLRCTSTKPCGAAHPHEAIIRLSWGEYGGIDGCLVAAKRIRDMLDASRENYTAEPITRESSHVEAWGSSHVEAWESVSIAIQSDSVTAALFGFAVAICAAKAKIKKHSKTATIVRPKIATGTKAWLERHVVKTGEGFAILYKRVSAKLLTQETTANETAWTVGTTLKHKDYSPKDRECGPGKFHACPVPYFADEFRSNAGDRYIAISVPVKSLYAWPDNPQYPHKIAFGECAVLHECDRYGNKIATKEAA